MKYKKSSVTYNVHKIPELRFDDGKLTSFAGAIIFQKLFHHIRLHQKIKDCFRHLMTFPIYGYERIVMIIILNIILGYRHVASVRYLRQDPIYRRIVGLKQIPSASTITRSLRQMDRRSYRKYKAIPRKLVLGRLALEKIARLTLDFDGSVNSTKSRTTEGTAVGFNKQKKGSRSYYPLHCTVAQTGQILDHLFRPGNVHDANRSLPFIRYCILLVRSVLSNAILESRMDSAFFSEKTVKLLDKEGVLFTISVPFHRWAALKKMVERKRKWKRINGEWSCFEMDWKPKSWDVKFRFIAIRQRVHKIRREPIQLDLFKPEDGLYDYKVIVTNMSDSARKVLRFHNGRGVQETVFGELKSHAHMGYIPTRRLIGNQIFMTSAILVHNLVRELQMILKPRKMKNGMGRGPLWKFETLRTLRERTIQIAGRLIRPQGKLVMTMNTSEPVQKTILEYLEMLNTD